MKSVKSVISYYLPNPSTEGNYLIFNKARRRAHTREGIKMEDNGGSLTLLITLTSAPSDEGGAHD